MRLLLPFFLILPACAVESDADDAGATETEGAASTGAQEESTAADPTNPGTSEDTGDDPTTGGPMGDSSTGDDDDDDDDDDDADTSTGEPPPVGTPGCDAAMPLAEGEHVFDLDGYERRYVVRLPENYTPDQPWPLIFALHGNGGNTGYWDQTGGDRDIRTAFATEAIIIIPEAINNAWRDYDLDPVEWPPLMELELAYFDSVYETAQDELCLDTSKVFSMGFSGGGSFSGVLGCRRDYIRAIAVGGSVIYFEEEDCTETPAAWITIGEDEYTSGREAFRNFFRDHAGCMESSMPGMPGGCENYDGCGADTPVTYCSHPAGHVWPSIGTDATKAFFQALYQD